MRDKRGTDSSGDLDPYEHCKICERNPEALPNLHSIECRQLAALEAIADRLGHISKSLLELSTKDDRR